MANTLSEKKAIIKRKQAYQYNRAVMKDIKLALKAVKKSVANADKNAAQLAFRVAESKLAQGAQKGVLHRNTAARKASRLSAAIKKLEGPLLLGK